MATWKAKTLKETMEANKVKLQKRLAEQKGQVKATEEEIKKIDEVIKTLS